MKKNNKLLLSFLALNSIVSVYASGENILSSKYEKLYGNMLKNIENGKDNKKNYKLLEQVLNQRNKELKDLYLQSDYIVKPEYLEWQIFFNGFYDEYGKGVDNSSENAKYHSKVTGYYTDNGNYITTSGIMGDGISGKPYNQLQQVKDINLGVNIPLKGITKEPLELSIAPIEELTINPNTLNVSPPTGMSIPQVNVIEFQPITPIVSIFEMPTVPIFSLGITGSGNGDGAFYTQNGGSNAVISQWDMDSGVFDIYSTGYSRYTYTYSGVTNEAPSMNGDVGGGRYTSTGTLLSSGGSTTTVSQQGFYRVVGAPMVRLGSGVIFNMEGDHNPNTIQGLQHIFHYDAHADRAFPLDTLVTNSVISSSERSEFTKYVNNTNVELFQLVKFEGEINLKGSDVLAVNLQNHWGKRGVTSVFKNEGSIIGHDDITTSNYEGKRQVVFAWTEDQTDTRKMIFDNSGKLELRAADSVAYYITSGLSKVAATIVYNTGETKLYGMQNIGFYSKGGYSAYNPAVGLSNLGKLIFESPIEILGDKSIGIDLERPINGLESKFNVKLGGGINQYSGNDTASGYDPLLIEESTGLYYNMVKGHASTITTLDDYKITADSFTKNNSLVRVEEGELYLGDGNSTNNTGKNNEIVSDGGNGNILVSALGKNSLLTLDSSAIVKGINGVNQIGLYTSDLRVSSGGGGTISFAGTLDMHGDASKGIIVDETVGTGAKIINTGNINISGGVYTDASNVQIGSVGVAVKGQNSSFISNTAGSSVKVEITGKESTGIFTENGIVDIVNGEIKASDGAFNLYSKGTTGQIKLKDTTLETGKSSLLFYNENNGVFNLNNVTANIKGGTTSNDRGTAFYYQGSGTNLTVANLTSYFGAIFAGTAGQLTLNMEQGSRLFIVDNVQINLSTAEMSASIPGAPIINGSDFITYMMYKSDLGIDQNINLDVETDAYNNLEIITSKITNNGFNIIGSQANKIAMAQENGFTSVGGVITPMPKSTVTLTNDGGLISLGGVNSLGIYANFGEIYNKNAGTINVTGDSSIGIYAVNGTEVTNENGSTINIGKDGVGIFAEGYKGGVAQGIIDGTLNIKNNGLIQAGTGTGAIGIYLNNNTGGAVAQTSSIIELSNGQIDVRNSENGVGVFVNGGNLKDITGSSITVGKNGVAVYAKDSIVDLTNTTINLFGDNSLGLYLDGTTSLINGTGTINIDGKNVVLFNLSSSGTINNNFTVGSVQSGSTYTLGNIVNGILEYTGSSVLMSNGLLVNGKDSAVYLSPTSSVTADVGGEGIAAIALDGQYTGGGTRPAGMTSNVDGENAGIITLNDQSVGLYGKNDSRLSNKNIIKVGNSSAGIMTSGVGSFAENSGTIEVGSGSQGIYVKDGTYIHNMSTGLITSTEIGSVGIYANNNAGTTMQVINDKDIILNGDRSIGIYSVGTNIHDIDNNVGAHIQVGDSSNVSDPSIGIYSSILGSDVSNTGTISSGINSIGIYNNAGTTYNNGTFNIGNSGIGVYSTGGTVHLDTGTTLNMGTNDSVGVYGINSGVINEGNLNLGSKNYGFIMKGGTFRNSNILSPSTSTMDDDSVFMYSTEGIAVENNGNVLMTGSDSIGFYMAKDPVSNIGGATMVNNGNITGVAGKNNVGIYNYGGIVDNYGTVSVGASELKFKDELTKEEIDIENSKYSVGIYGEDSIITNYSGGLVSAGYGAYGIVAKGGVATNYGLVQTNGDYSTGMYTESGKIVNENRIDVTGNNTIGMAGKGIGSEIINNGLIRITGENAIGMYGNIGTRITNTGTIEIYGSGKLFVSSDPTDPLHNVSSSGAVASINGVTDNTIYAQGNIHTLPELINAGIIKASGVLALDGLQIMVKPDPSTKQPSTNPDYDFELSGTSIIADRLTTTKPIVILPGFADGTIANVYKLENVVQASSGTYDFISGSLLWESTPRATNDGVDIYMSRKAFTEFTEGLWFEDFGVALENGFLSATGDGIEIYNKTGYIKTEENFRQIMGSLAGNVYANINQRENDIARTLESSLNTLQGSTNNTKENVKVNVIVGKGKNKEKTDGVVGYDYTTTGILGLREVERTYKHTFGYSLGYLHTGFEFKDGNESEEWVDTIQLGVHNKYKTNGWVLRNDVTGRVSIHNVDRNIDWEEPLKRSEMNGSYETYSITSDNVLGKEFELGKRASIMPYGGFRAMYVVRPTFKEKGLEALEVDGNDAWSAKPRAGVELKGSLPLGKSTTWELKGSLDVSYEYELADLNEREKAKLVAIEDGYHKLSKPEDEKGTFRTKASVGVEVEDRYGIYVTGEYSTGNDKEDDYRAGLAFKVAF